MKQVSFQNESKDKTAVEDTNEESGIKENRFKRVKNEDTK